MWMTMLLHAWPITANLNCKQHNSIHLVQCWAGQRGQTIFRPSFLNMHASFDINLEAAWRPYKQKKTAIRNVKCVSEYRGWDHQYHLLSGSGMPTISLHPPASRPLHLDIPVLVIDRPSLACSNKSERGSSRCWKWSYIPTPDGSLVRNTVLLSAGTIVHSKATALLSFAILSPELLNLDLDLLADTSSELRSISELEQNFKPHKHGS